MPHKGERYEQDQADELTPSNPDEMSEEARDMSTGLGSPQKPQPAEAGDGPASGNTTPRPERLAPTPGPESPHRNPDKSERDVPARLTRGFPVSMLEGTSEASPDYRPQSEQEDDRSSREREETRTAAEGEIEGRDNFSPADDEIDPDAGLETGLIEQDDEAALGLQKPSVDG